jgi:hypothetical protein
MDGGRSSTFAGKQPGAGGSNPLPWILGAIGLVVLLGVGGVIALIAVVASKDDPEPPVSTTAANQPKVEAPPAATAVSTFGSPSSTIAVKTPATVRPPPTIAPTRTATAPTPSPFPTPTAPPTSTNGSSSGALAPFNRTKAQDDVDRVAAGLGSCKQSSGPFGAGSIRIDFEPDGRVGTLSRPPFAGTAVGACISSRFLAIRLGPFSGTTQNIEKAFIIQQ